MIKPSIGSVVMYSVMTAIAVLAIILGSVWEIDDLSWYRLLSVSLLVVASFAIVHDVKELINGI